MEEIRHTPLIGRRGSLPGETVEIGEGKVYSDESETQPCPRLRGKCVPPPVRRQDQEGVLMATWNSRGLRGSTLEELINRTCEQLRERGLALIQKVPTPITPINIDKTTRHITLAYFDQKSTVDYLGVVQGIPVCFDAKECAEDTFPLANIHEHQVAFMSDFEKQDGISFLLLHFTSRDEFYYMPYREMMEFWNRMKCGGRKSFLISELDPGYFLDVSGDTMLPFLEGLQRDLDERGDPQETG